MPTIVNNFTFPVILYDNRDADQSWTRHQETGLGGVDLAYPYGSPVLATADGFMQYFDGNGRVGRGSGGNIGRLRLADGSFIELLHLSKSMKTGPVKIGDVVALSGGSGYGNLWYYDPHLHVHVYIKGVRRNLFDYFTTSATAGTNTKEIDMALDAVDKKWLNGMGQSIIDQVGTKEWLSGLGEAIVSQLAAQIGPRTWSEPITHSGVTGPASAWLGNMSDAVGRLKLSGDGADCTAFAADLRKTLPAEVVAAIKAAL